MSQEREIVQKASKVEVLHRVEEILECFAMKMKRSEIQAHVRDNCDWGVSEGQIDNYIRKAREELEHAVKKSASRLLAESVLDYTVIFKRSMLAKDYGAAIRARQLLDKRLGVDRADPSDVDHNQLPDSIRERARLAREVGPEAEQEDEDE